MKFEKDVQTRVKKINTVDDISLLKIFKSLDCESANYSNYEQVHFLIGLNKDCPKKHEKNLNIVFFGGTLGNILVRLKN
jgi:hypothetical protein